MKKKKVKVPKVIYFCDIPFDGDNKSDWYVREIQLEKVGIEGLKPEITTTPPFDKSYDILFFDWGGMSIGNDLLHSFCRQIIDIANDNPSRMFVMASLFTTEAMKDAQMEFGDNIPSNIYLTFEDFSKACKDQGLLKKGKLTWA